MPVGDDFRLHLEVFGIHYNDWDIDFGSFSDHHKILIEEYISDAADTNATSVASDTNKFIFPEHIKKDYFIEGTIIGHITVAASEATSHVSSYRVTLCRVNESTSNEYELYTTGWIDVNDTLDWNATYNVGEEAVYEFRIDAWEYKELGEYDRLYLKVEVNCDQYAVLWHSNDANWNDLYVDIPIRV